MRRAAALIRDQFDRAGILISGLCMVHCLLSVIIVSVLGLGGELLLSPAIHRIGLALAVTIGAGTLGYGLLRHGEPAPLAIGACGLSLMAVALFIGHGALEALLTVCGVVLVAIAHIRNLRHTA